MHKKIDLYIVHRANGRVVRKSYLCSTNWSKTCREAVARFHEINGADYLTGKNLAPLNSEIVGHFA